MPVVSIVNQKGGCGKTTTAYALATGLALRNYKVLTIDMDGQCNLTYTYGADTDNLTIYNVLMDNTPIADTIQHTHVGDIVPAVNQMVALDYALQGNKKEYLLKDAIEPIADDYDFIIIDTPPSTGVVVLNALTASDVTIITAQPAVYDIQGIGQIYGSIQSIQAYTNPNLVVLGILLTRYRTRTTFSASYVDIASQMASMIHSQLFDVHIRESIIVQESEDHQKSLYEYAPRAKVTKDYEQFVEEFLTKLKKVAK